MQTRHIVSSPYCIETNPVLKWITARCARRGARSTHGPAPAALVDCIPPSYLDHVSARRQPPAACPSWWPLCPRARHLLHSCLHIRLSPTCRPFERPCPPPFAHRWGFRAFRASCFVEFASAAHSISFCLALRRLATFTTLPFRRPHRPSVPSPPHPSLLVVAAPFACFDGLPLTLLPLILVTPRRYDHR